MTFRNRFSRCDPRRKIIRPEGFPEGSRWCEDFIERAIAAARTYQARKIAQMLLPVGERRDNFNYLVERKRILNGKRLVSQEDNVKQHAYTHENSSDCKLRRL